MPIANPENKTAYSRQARSERTRAEVAEADRGDRIAVLRALLSFTYWEELRRHARLSNVAASRVLRNDVRAVLGP